MSLPYASVLDINQIPREDYPIKIALEEPYASMYKRGSVTFHYKSGRRMVLLGGPLNPILKDTGVNFARYLYQVDLWKRTSTWIPEGYEVDHINDDRTDDRLCNLQLLTHEQNNIKRSHLVYRGKSLLACLCCGDRFLLDSSYIKKNRKHFDVRTFCCSKQCNGTWLSFLSNYPQVLAATMNNQVLRDDIREYNGVAYCDLFPNWYPYSIPGSVNDTPYWRYKGLSHIRGFLKRYYPNTPDINQLRTPQEKRLLRLQQVLPMIIAGDSLSKACSLIQESREFTGKIIREYRITPDESFESMLVRVNNELSRRLSGVSML